MKENENNKRGQMEAQDTTTQQYVLLNESENKQVSLKSVENTPFSILVDTSKGYTIVIGSSQAIPEYKKSEEECLELIKNKDWHLITAMIVEINKLINKQ